MEWLDKIISNTFYATALILVFLFLFVGLSFLNPFKKKALNYIYRFLMYFIPFSLLMSMNFTYWGLVEEFKSICVGDNTVCLYEEYERGAEYSETVTRLHILDKKTGKRSDRFYTGSYGALVGMHRDTLCFLHEKTLVLMNAATLEEIYRIKEEDWGNVSPELAAGINSIGGNYHSDHVLLPLIELDCKNGRHYFFDPFSKKLLPAKPADTFLPEFSMNSYELCIDYSFSKKDCFLKTAYAGSNALQRIVPAEDKSQLFKGSDAAEYIYPFLLCIDTLKKVFVFGHHTTTDRLDFIIEAKDFNFKTIWKKSSAQLGANDTYCTPVVNCWKYKNDILYFNAGGFAVALSPVSGEVEWVTRL